MTDFPHVLCSVNDLRKEQVEMLLARAREFKVHQLNPFSLNPPSPFNRKQIMATFFLENSTRTKMSFMMAAKEIGLRTLDFDAKTSSLNKGESLEETLLTLKSMGVDIVVYRTPHDKEIEQFKSHAPLKMINAGDGTHEHPTQALLDLFTMGQVGLKPRNTHIALIGDCQHSRVANSQIKLLTSLGAKITIVTPKELFTDDFKEYGVNFTDDIDEALKACDMAYVLRIQNERHHDDKLSKVFDNYHEKFGINSERLQKLGIEIPIFHPGPVNIGVELSKEIMRTPLYQGYRQVQNGVYIRMAIIEAMAKLERPTEHYTQGTLDDNKYYPEDSVHSL